MTEHPYLSQTRLEGLQYIVVPKALLAAAPRLGLDVDDAVMYCVLRSRCDLSLRSGWLDELGRVYIYYTREQMASYLGWGKKKTIDAFRRLCEAGLIAEQAMESRNHTTTAKRIYVRLWSAPYDADTAITGLRPEEIRAGGLPFLNRDNIRAMTGSYYVIPRLLLEHPEYEKLPLRAKLLYVITMDRLSLSLEFGQVEKMDSGETVPYCYLDRKELENALQCSDRTMTTLFKALEDNGLMERRRPGFRPECRVYLRDFLPSQPSDTAPQIDEPDGDPAIFVPQAAKIEPPIRKNQTPEAQKSNPRAAKAAPAGAQESNPSDPFSVKQNRIPFAVSLARGREATAEEKKDFSVLLARLHWAELPEDLAALCSPQSLPFALQILELCGDILEEDFAFPGHQIRFGADFLPKHEVLAEYGRLDRYILLTMIVKITEQPDVHRLREYIHRCLFTAAAKHEGESYYTRLRLEAPPPSPAASSCAGKIDRSVLRRFLQEFDA